MVEKKHRIKLCPKCGAEMGKFQGDNKKDISYECPNKKCGYWELNKFGMKLLEKSMREVKEGRTYIMACGTKTKRSRRCSKSGEKLWICPTHHFEDCKKWYKLGKKDAVSKVFAEIEKEIERLQKAKSKMEEQKYGFDNAEEVGRHEAHIADCEERIEFLQDLRKKFGVK